MTRLNAFAVGAVSILLLAGCGGGSPQALSADASRVLAGDVSRLQAAASTHDVAAVDAAARRLRADLTAQQRTGAVRPERAQGILAQLTAVLADTAATSVTPAQPTPAATRGGGRKGHGDGKGGKHEGDGGGDGQG